MGKDPKKNQDHVLGYKKIINLCQHLIKIFNLNVQRFYKTSLTTAKNCTDNQIIQKVVDKGQANVFEMIFYNF